MSLLEKLQMISSQPQESKKPDQRKFTSCWQEEKLLEDDIYENIWDISTDTLSLMQSEKMPEDFSPEDILFLDTETTGLGGGAGTLAFLVGLGWMTEDGFTVRQYVMRDYPEEKFLLQNVAETASEFKAFCTFNGKTFDIPLLRSRFLMNRLDDGILDLPHIDLMHIARSVWKMRLKKCNLTNLEEKILGQTRESDLPGSEAPQRFFSFLKTGQFDLLRDVIDHNRQDVASLCVLLRKMCSMYENPEQVAFGEDLLSMGKSLERRSHASNAQDCYQLAMNLSSGALQEESRWQLSQSFRRQGKIAEAAEIWKSMADHGEGGIEPCVALAKYYEHNVRDIGKAKSITEKAMSIVAEPSFNEKDDSEKQINQLMHRYRRLIKKEQKK